MIRYLTAFCLFFFTQAIVFAQSTNATLENIRAAAGKNQWSTAKENIDSYLAIETNTRNADAWYLKSLVYYNILNSSSAALAGETGYPVAFGAYKKYIELKDKEKDTSNKEHEILFGISFNLIEKANNDFRAKRFPEALKSFQQVEEMEDFIVKRNFSYQGFSFPAFDTQLYVNIAAAAVSAGKEDIAMRYYQKIADNRIVSEGFSGIYRYLVDKFDKKGNKQERDKYIQIGKTLYPEDEYWCQVGLRDAGTDKKKLFARYEELLAGNCNNYLINFNYAAELYNYYLKPSPRPADYAKQHAKIPAALKRAISSKSTTDANLLMCRYQLAMINELIDGFNAIPDNSADKAKKKEGLTTQLNQRYEEVFTYATNAYNSINISKHVLQPKEKEHYATACKILSDYWERKGDKAKAQEFSEKARMVN